MAKCGGTDGRGRSGAEGVESGDELLDRIPEMGQNYFTEMDTAGGINSARGDVGAVAATDRGAG